MDITASLDQAQEALAVARDADDPALLTRALTACACVTAHDPDQARPYFEEAIGLARALGDSWRLSQILGRQAYGAFMVGDLLAVEPIATEGRDLADAIGDHFDARQCRWVLVDVQISAATLSVPSHTLQTSLPMPSLHTTSCRHCDWPDE